MDFLVDFPWSLVAESWIRWYISITIDLWTLLPEWAYLPYSKWVQTIVICFYYCAIMMVSCFSASKTTQNKMTIGLMFRPCKAICFPLDPLCTKPCRILHHVGSYVRVQSANFWGWEIWTRSSEFRGFSSLLFPFFVFENSYFETLLVDRIESIKETKSERLDYTMYSPTC